MLHAMFHTFTHHKKGAAQNAMHLETQPSGVQEAWKKTFEKQLGRASGISMNPTDSQYIVFYL